MEKQQQLRSSVATAFSLSLSLITHDRNSGNSAGGKRSAGAAAQRLLTRYRNGGGGTIIHKVRGQPSNYQLSAAVRDYVLEVIRQNYRDFGPTPRGRVLLERHGLKVSRETLRKWMIDAGL